jgi:hypothetical protein
VLSSKMKYSRFKGKSQIGADRETTSTRPPE